MAKISRFNEKDLYSELDSIFSMLKSYGRSEDDFNFLESLNLTTDQYVKLARIMENFGEEKYGDGYQEGRQDGWADNAGAEY